MVQNHAKLYTFRKKNYVVHKNRASETFELITVVGARDRSVNQSDVKKNRANENLMATHSFMEPDSKKI